MRTVHLWLLGVFLTSCVLLPVVRQGSLAGRPVMAAPVAQSETIGAAAATVCLADPICLAGVAVLAAIAIYAGYEITDGNLFDFVADARDWLMGDTQGAVQMRTQLTRHPYYVDMTADMIVELAAEFGEAGDWVALEHAGVDAYLRSTTGDRMTLTFDGLVWPSGHGGTEGCLLATAVGDGPGGLNTSDGYSYGWRIYAAGDCGGTVLETYYVADFEAASPGWQIPGGHGDPEHFSMVGYGVLVPGQSYCVQIVLPDVAAPTGAGYEWLGATAFKMQTWIYDAPAHGHTTSVPLWSAIVTTEYGTLEEQRAWVPASTWYPQTWDGTSDIPRADGWVGPAVVPLPVPLIDDEGWWEGLFGGLGGKLTGIWEGIQSIGGTLTDVWELVQALPATMTAAIAAAVVPTTSVSERTDTLRGTLAGKAPFAWPAIVFAMVGDLFEGGTDCPVIDFGTDAVDGWPAVEIEMCVPAGAQTILYTITDVVAAALVMVWAFWAYRRLVGA